MQSCGLVAWPHEFIAFYFFDCPNLLVPTTVNSSSLLLRSLPKPPSLSFPLLPSILFILDVAIRNRIHVFPDAMRGILVIAEGIGIGNRSSKPQAPYMLSWLPGYKI